MACIFDKCCCCIDLRSGCLIIGYVSLIGEIVAILMTLLAVIGGGAVAAAGQDQETKDVGIGLLIISVILLLLVLLLFTFTIVLLVGIHKNKPKHVKVYLVFATICLAIWIILFFAGFAQKIVVANVIRDIIYFIVEVYFLLVIRSYYVKMNDKRGAIYSAA